MLPFGLNVLLLHSLYCFSYFLLYENCLFLLSLKTQQCCMPTKPRSQFFFPNAERLQKKDDQSLCIRKQALGTRLIATKTMVRCYVISNA